jgi:hypothetical protein
MIILGNASDSLPRRRKPPKLSTLKALRTLKAEKKPPMLRTLKTLKVLNAESRLPVLPIERKLPVLPILRILAVLPMLRILAVLPILNRLPLPLCPDSLATGISLSPVSRRIYCSSAGGMGLFTHSILADVFQQCPYLRLIFGRVAVKVDGVLFYSQ